MRRACHNYLELFAACWGRTPASSWHAAKLRAPMSGKFASQTLRLLPYPHQSLLARNPPRQPRPKQDPSCEITPRPHPAETINFLSQSPTSAGCPRPTGSQTPTSLQRQRSCCSSSRARPPHTHTCSRAPRGTLTGWGVYPPINARACHAILDPARHPHLHEFWLPPSTCYLNARSANDAGCAAAAPFCQDSINLPVGWVSPSTEVETGVRIPRFR